MIIFEYVAITVITVTFIGWGCVAIAWIVNRIAERRKDRVIRDMQLANSLEIQARAAMVWNQYLTHIQPKHHYEFIRYVSHGEFCGGGSFERAVLTDKMYIAAIFSRQMSIECQSTQLSIGEGLI